MTLIKISTDELNTVLDSIMSEINWFIMSSYSNERDGKQAKRVKREDIENILLKYTNKK